MEWVRKYVGPGYDAEVSRIRELFARTEDLNYLREGGSMYVEKPDVPDPCFYFSPGASGFGRMLGATATAEPKLDSLMQVSVAGFGDVHGS